MGHITELITMNLCDLEACLLAISDGHPEVASQILNEYRDVYYEDLENELEEE